MGQEIGGQMHTIKTVYYLEQIRQISCLLACPQYGTDMHKMDDKYVHSTPSTHDVHTSSQWKNATNSIRIVKPFQATVWLLIAHGRYLHITAQSINTVYARHTVTLDV